MTEDNRTDLVSLFVEIIKNQKSHYKNMVRLFVVIFVLYTLLFGYVVFTFFSYEKQFEYTETYTYSEEVEQEASGDSATINNVKGNQYNDDAVHNEGE